MTGERRRREDFVQGVGDLLASWSLSHATGRVYAELLLVSEPTTLDALARALGLSKGAVSTAVRELVSWGLARTIPQRGSRLLRIEAIGSLETLLEASHARARLLVRTLHDGESLAEGADARERLRDVTGLFESYLSAGEQMLRSHRERGERRTEEGR